MALNDTYLMIGVEL
jgi:RNA polymerase subunit RPABC4/transcription elongation factor Spt4